MSGNNCCKVNTSKLLALSIDALLMVIDFENSRFHPREHRNGLRHAEKNLYTFVNMESPNSIQKKASRLGLLLVFLLSAVVMPAFSAERGFASEQHLHFVSHQDSHCSPTIPLPLPEEEKEEESRADKNRALAFTLFCDASRLPSGAQARPTTWEFNHTNASALTGFPLYLTKQSLLI
jgi:hypothetical protein